MPVKFQRIHKTIVFTLLLLSTPCGAEIVLLKGNRQGSQGPDRLDFQVGGSIRPQFQEVMGDKDRGSYKRRVFDGGTRFRFHLSYFLNDDLTWINYYQVGVNVPRMMHWKGHYAKSARNTGNRQLYSGIKSERWGELTYGQHNSVYWETVSRRTNLWSNNLHGDPVSIGINGNYDGSWHPRKSLRYIKKMGRATLYGSYLFEEHELAAKKGIRYKRHGGGAAAFDYMLTPELKLSGAWMVTRASLRQVRGEHSPRFSQTLLGSGMSWTPGTWTLSVSGGWYRHFVTSGEQQVSRYFSTSGWGLTYYIAHLVPVNCGWLEGVKPYYFGVQLRVGDNRRRYQVENGLAVALMLAKGVHIDFQHVFRSSNDHIGDLNLIRIQYDF